MRDLEAAHIMSLPQLNRYGYLAAASTVLAAVLFVLDGGAYRTYAVLSLGVAVLTVADAMARSSSADQGADRPADDRQNRREKEMKMESGGYGGNGGGG
jgi:hypothetical protein